MNAVILRRRKLGRGSTRGIQQFSERGITPVRNWVPGDWQGLGGVADPLIVFRWGCTSDIPDLPGNRANIVNTAASIHWCSDKRTSRLAMQEAGVPVPESFGVGTGNQIVPYPLTDDLWVGRPERHAQGRNLFVGNTAQCVRQVSQWGGGYISRLINKVAEYRVFVCQNRAVWVARKTPGNPDQVAWNVAQGGRFDNVRWGEWPKPVLIAALKAAKVSGTDFCGVDVMVDAEGNPHVLEVNSAPSQTSEYRQRCVAKVFDYIIANGKQHFEDFEDTPRKTWRSYIHPALKEE